MVPGLVVAVAAAPTVGPAQIVFPLGASSVVGRIYDSTSGAGIIRARICREYTVPIYGRALRCASTDTLGQFSFDSLTEGINALAATCLGITPFAGRQLLLDTLVLAPHERRRLDIRTDSKGCDQRPLIVRRGTFKGFYSAGFEHSRFIPFDDPDAWIWVRFSNLLEASHSPPWPAFPDTVPYPCVFVEWVGTLTGPGLYGHMSVSTHQLVVDTIRSVRPARSQECGV